MNPAETYEHALVPASFAPSAELLLDAVKPREGERLLDVACGTGIVARKAASRVSLSRVVGTDVSAPMLEVARGCAAREGRAIEFLEVPAERLPFDSGSFDLLTCQHGVQFFADRKRAMAEFARVCGPEGRAAVAVWSSLEQQPVFAALNEACVKHLGAPAFARPFSFGSENELGLLLLSGGFSDIDVRTVEIESHNPPANVWLTGAVHSAAAVLPELGSLDAKGRNVLVEKVRREVGPVLARYVRGDELVFPMRMILGLAR